MTEGDLDEFVSRAQSALERSPSMGQSATELRVVLPFLKTLGWGVHGPDVVPDHAVDGPEGTITVDFALCLDGTPTTFVVADGAGSDLTPDDGKRLATAMRAAGVEWGLATNGHAYAFLTMDGGEARRSGSDLADLPDNEAVVGEYTRAAAVERREARAQEHRQEVVDDLADERSTLVDAVRTTLLDAADDPGPVEGELATASETFVDGVLAALSDGDHPATFGPEDVTPTTPDAGAGTADGATGATSDATDGEPGSHDAGTDAGSESRDRSGSENEERNDDGDDEPERPDTEFVVRFFNGRSSVGAVGHSTAPGAMAQAIEYMVEQHALDNRLNLPWGGDDGRAIVNYEPVHPDGTEMGSATQLSNGYYVDTTVDVSVSRAAVEQLAEHSGLRVMFRGDWP